MEIIELEQYDGERNMKDRTIECRDCGNQFVFSAREQEFFAEKGFQEPKRCKHCRDSRKSAKRERNQRQEYEVVCDKCGDITHVPFRPSVGRSIYCKPCYASRA